MFRARFSVRPISIPLDCLLIAVRRDNPWPPSGSILRVIDSLRRRSHGDDLETQRTLVNLIQVGDLAGENASYFPMLATLSDAPIAPFSQLSYLALIYVDAMQRALVTANAGEFVRVPGLQVLDWAALS